jgi:glutathione S-transferase
MTSKLYSFGESGNCYKAALMLELCGLPWEQVFVDGFKGGSRTEDFASLNPMKEVPVLVHHGKRYTQSGVMLDVLSRETGRFGPASEDDRLEILRWTVWDNHKLSSQIGTLRYQMNFLPAERRSQPVIDFLIGRCHTALNILESHLYGRDWIAADAATTADLSCCGYLYYPEEFGFSRSDYPGIDAWLSRISDLPGWKHPYDLMERAFS